MIAVNYAVFLFRNPDLHHGLLGLEYEQSLSGRKIAIILVRCTSNRLADLLRHVPEILKVLSSIKSRQLVRVGA